jgi:two-component system nitrogen regulation sensor histidine kinase GlnL
VIIGESDRLQALLNRLLTPHRLPAYRRTSIHEILDASAQRGSRVSAIDVASDFDISLPEFDADPEQLTQVVLNIARNAAQALPRRRRIRRSA